MISMKKGGGWFQESYRHGLSARGIKTSKIRSKPRNGYKKFDWKMHKELPDDRYNADKVIGGLGDGMPDWKFDPDQLFEGTRHEMEHTNDPEIAEEIAKDHLVEDPYYYAPGHPGHEEEKKQVGISLKDNLDWFKARNMEKHKLEVERLDK